MENCPIPCSLYLLVVAFGQDPCTNLSPLRLSNLLCPGHLGRLVDYSQWLTGNVRCQKCNGKVTKLSGVICGNFGVPRFGSWCCNGVWHAQCYVQSEKDKFPVLSAIDLDGSLVDDATMEEDDREKFKVARDGDHMLVPFQCDICQFLNIHNRFPIKGNHADDLLLICIRRVILDSMWARERSTVRSNLYEIRRYVKLQATLGLEHQALPPQEPFPLRDDWGIRFACAMVLRSMDQGRNSWNIQCGTVRKLRSCISNYSHASRDGLGLTFMSEDGMGARVSFSATNTFWFKRFMQGLHRRMGDLWMPNKATSRYVIRGCFTVLDHNWDFFGIDNYSKLSISRAACIIITGYYGGLRGEEIGKAYLGAIRYFWNEGISHPDHPHVPLILAGSFKGETGIKLFCQPLAAITRDGRNLESWFSRYVSCLQNCNITSGPLFWNDKGSAMSVAELDIPFHAVLLEVQRRFESIIPDSVKVEEEYSVNRSLRRGATSEAQNVGMSQTIIESNNRWRKTHRAKGMTPGWSMMEHYTDAKVAAPSLIRFSAELPS